MTLSFSKEQIDGFNTRKTEASKQYDTYQAFVADVIGKDPMEDDYVVPEDFDVEIQSTVGVRGNVHLRERKVLTPKEQKEISKRAFL